MKFNEKLIELRKKEGLSQEELGYKLNVTRQTVSKWELGQTTPEMDKLVEMSRIFNISVDQLINDSEIESKGSAEYEIDDATRVTDKEVKVYVKDDAGNIVQPEIKKDVQLEKMQEVNTLPFFEPKKVSGLNKNFETNVLFNDKYKTRRGNGASKSYVDIVFCDTNI